MSTEKRYFDRTISSASTRRSTLYDENIDGIEGHVVTFPLRFLENEIDNFGLRLLSAEGLLPEWNYT